MKRQLDAGGRGSSGYRLCVLERGRLRKREGVEQGAVAHTDRSPHVAPEAILVHLEEQPSATVAILPPSHRYAAGQRLVGDAQVGQGSYTVARQVDAHPPLEGPTPLDERAAHATPRQDPGDGSSRDTAADDEDGSGHARSGFRPQPMLRGP